MPSEPLKRFAVRATPIALLRFVCAAIRVLEVHVLDDLPAENLPNDYAVAPPHFADSRAVVQNQLDVFLTYDRSKFVEYFLLHYSVGTVVPAVAHQDVVERHGVHLQPIARVVTAVIVTSRNNANVVCLVKLAHHLYDWLPRCVVQHAGLIERVANTEVVSHGAINVHEYPLGVRQTDSPPALREELRPLEVRARQLVFFFGLLCHVALSQILSLLLNDAFADHNAGELTTFAARYTASLIALDARL